MAGTWLAMSRVCSGRISPLRAHDRPRADPGSGSRLWVVPAGGFVLSVPASFYDDTGAVRKRRRVMLGVALAAVLACAAGLTLLSTRVRRAA